MAEDEEFNDAVEDNEISNLGEDLNEANQGSVAMGNMAAAAGGSPKDSNFLHIQISNTEMLEKLEHFYRGDKWGIDKDGDYTWLAPDNRELVTFNDFGVTTMMDIVTKYIDKNTTLSYYGEERIYEIMGDLGDELVLLILSNYKQMGMDTYYKKTKFRMVIVTTLHMIESAYRRALRGRTLEEVNQSRIIGQFGNLPRSNDGAEIGRNRGIPSMFQGR